MTESLFPGASTLLGCVCWGDGGQSYCGGYSFLWGSGTPRQLLQETPQLASAAGDLGEMEL